MTESPSAERMAELQKQMAAVVEKCEQIAGAPYEPLMSMVSRSEVQTFARLVLKTFAAASRYDYARAAEDKRRVATQADEIKRLRGALEKLIEAATYYGDEWLSEPIDIAREALTTRTEEAV